MSASKRSLERARKWFQSQPAQEHEDFLRSLAAEFDAVAREARLDEAKWWQRSCSVECNGCAMTEGYGDKRIAELEKEPG